MPFGCSNSVGKGEMSELPAGRSQAIHTPGPSPAATAPRAHAKSLRCGKLLLRRREAPRRRSCAAFSSAFNRSSTINMSELRPPEVPEIVASQTLPIPHPSQKSAKVAPSSIPLLKSGRGGHACAASRSGIKSSSNVLDLRPCGSSRMASKALAPSSRRRPAPGNRVRHACEAGGEKATGAGPRSALAMQSMNPSSLVSRGLAADPNDASDQAALEVLRKCPLCGTAPQRSGSVGSNQGLIQPSHEGRSSPMSIEARPQTTCRKSSSKFEKFSVIVGRFLGVSDAKAGVFAITNLEELLSTATSSGSSTSLRGWKVLPAASRYLRSADKTGSSSPKDGTAVLPRSACTCGRGAMNLHPECSPVEETAA
mmetsp:Transcript_33671/g.68907  ORF Transcript_33671/g.68907 Transcript_33671/m.68907 type:complete len:368 (+) Transcript_33671:1049-2152(+)